MLIERGADLKTQNRDGQTPLHLALYRGRVDIAHMLTERGTDLTAQNNDGETSLRLTSAPSLWARISPQIYSVVAHICFSNTAQMSMLRIKMGSSHQLLHGKVGLQKSYMSLFSMALILAPTTTRIEFHSWVMYEYDSVSLTWSFQAHFITHVLLLRQLSPARQADGPHK